MPKAVNKMNSTIPPVYKELIDRCVIAIQAAQQGPDVCFSGGDTPTIDDYLPVLKGQTLNLQGQVCGHPRLGTTFVRTSMLIHVTDDGLWARTISRWYRLQKPRVIDTSEACPSSELNGFCLPLGTDGVGVPMHFARKVMDNKPIELSRMAKEIGYKDAALELSELSENWPPNQ